MCHVLSLFLAGEKNYGIFIWFPLFFLRNVRPKLMNILNLRKPWWEQLVLPSRWLGSTKSGKRGAVQTFWNGIFMMDTYIFKSGHLKLLREILYVIVYVHYFSKFCNMQHTTLQSVYMYIYLCVKLRNGASSKHRILQMIIPDLHFWDCGRAP